MIEIALGVLMTTLAGIGAWVWNSLDRRVDAKVDIKTFELTQAQTEKDIEEIKRTGHETRQVLFEIRDAMLAKGIIEP